ncbi:MAG: response regulator [Cyanobacteria bacterium J06650_10]
MEVLNELIERLEQLVDGELSLTNSSGQWRFYVLDGQLLYVSSSVLAVRRFDRAVRCYRPRWEWSVASEWALDSQSWELPLLERAIAQNQLSPIQIKLILRMVAEECLVELLCEGVVKSEWHPYHLESSSAYRSAALSATETRRILSKAERIAQSWKASPLGHLSLSATPIASVPGALGVLAIPSQCLEGGMTLWDILASHVSSLGKLTQLLLPLVESQKVTFQLLLDLPLPFEKPSAARLAVPQAARDLASSATTAQRSPSSSFASSAQPATATGKAPLIACIDDSPVLTLSLKKILTSAGYRTLSIPEPMRGFSKLIEYQPDLILLDLMLPNADGYSVCKFLRETPAFAKTPIIILTGQDSNLDRMRARLVGATEFLTKPPKPVALLEMIERHLS